MYQVGWDKQIIQIQAKGLAMFGFGSWYHRAYGQRGYLYARTILVATEQAQPLIFCCLDLGCITSAMRDGVSRILAHQPWFNPQRLVMFATHTHSAPGGCSYESLYNTPTPGFVPEHLNAIAHAAATSIQKAYLQQAETEIRFGTGRFAEHTPVAWNRSIEAYNRNPDVEKKDIEDTHLALDRQMQVFGFFRNDRAEALLSLFGVHATCLGNTLKLHCSDNKGYAASFSEQALAAQGASQPVAIFAQAVAGDVSPHFHGKGQWKKRQKIKGEAEYQYAADNGKLQSDLALSILSSTKPLQQEKLDTVYQYIDLANIHAKPEFALGRQNAKTSSACHGSAFFAGTPVDGRGTLPPVILGMKVLAAAAKKWLLSPANPEQAYYKALYASQEVKTIVLEAGKKRLFGQALDIAPKLLDPLVAEMNKQYAAGAIQDSEMVAHVVPIQIVQLGEFRIVCCAGEITTTAGRRLKQVVADVLSAQDPQSQTLLISYCNDYMGYVTTYEEYQVQAYEGGHTLFGQWTLAALQTKYQALAQALIKPVDQRQIDQSLDVVRPPAQELARRTNFGRLDTAVRQQSDLE